MHYLRKIREALGISQQEMAGLLGLKKSSLAMAETGKRKLPDNSRMLVAWMWDEMETWAQEEEPQPMDPETMDKEIRMLEARLENHRLELETRETREHKAALLQFVCSALEARFPGGIPVLSKKQIGIFQSEEDLRLNKHREDPPVFLQAKIKGMEARIASLKAAA